MSRLRQWLRQLAATYFAFDPRSLGLFRIALGVVLLVDLWQRYRGIDYWFTDGGLLPRSLLRGQPDLFSIFLLVSSHEGALAMMLLCALVYACFTIGFLTRVSHVLALVCVVSLNARAFVVENGGHLALNLLTIWSLFLPLGQRFSVDALARSLRARRERSVEELADRAQMRAVADRPVWSLAVCALLLQFAVIYGLNAAHKTGPMWQRGTAVHYVLQNDTINTIVAVWVCELPPSVLQFLSRATIAIEFAAGLLILSPLWSRHARLVAVMLLPALHLGFALCLRLGVFSFAMASFFALLLAPEHWQWLADRRRRKSERLRATAWIDAADAAWFQLARVYARLDPDQRVRFASGLAPGGLRVRDEATGTEVEGWPAALELIRRLPAGRPLAALAGLPGAAAIAEWSLAALRRPVRALARRLEPALLTRAERTPWSRPLLRGAGVVVGEAAVLLLMVAATGDLVHSNPVVPVAWRFHRPALLYRLVWIPRTAQSWHMFAPDPPSYVGTLSVEARTVDGRIVDPLNEVAGRFPRLPAGGTMPQRLGRDAFFQTYLGRVILHAWLRPGLRQWILRYPQRTGRLEDRIVAFDVYRMTAAIARPGSEQVKKIARSKLMSFPP